MDKTIYGNLLLDDEAYPFFLQDKVVCIVQQAYQYFNKLSRYKELPSVRGVTSDNQHILFINCRFRHGSVTVISIQGYILSTPEEEDPCDFTFNRLSFYSEALNVFYSPQCAASTSLGNGDTSPSNWDGAMDISIKPFSQTDAYFKFKDADCKFSISRRRNQKVGTPDIGNLQTALIFDFSNPKGTDTVIQYFRYVYDFLSFVNYSKGITFEKINLSRKYGDIYKVAYHVKIFLNTSLYEGTAFTSVTFRDLPSKKFSAIFEKIATLREQKEHKTRIQLYYPESTEESKYVDPSKWLITALCFDGLFENVFPDYKKNKKPDFRIAKDCILNAIDNNTDCNKLEGKQQKYYGKCREQIEHYEGMLEEKFNHVLKLHKIALSEVLSSMNLISEVSQNLNYGCIYQEYRNELAHGTISDVEGNKLLVYKLLRPMIYILLLDGVPLEEDELKRIIRKLFV